MSCCIITTNFVPMKYQKRNIGEIILRLLKEKGITQAEFGKAMNIQRQNLKATVFEKPSLDTNFLIRASEFLNEDLFCYYHPVDIEESDSCKRSERDIKATLTIELPEDKKDQILEMVLGEKAVNILKK